MDYEGTRICGVSDHLGAMQTCAFPRANPTKIGWVVTHALPSLTDDELIGSYDRQWKKWQAVCGIRPMFFKSMSEARAELAGGRINGLVIHGAGRANPLGSPGGVLAWSELPCGLLICRQEYDLAEAWIVWTNPGPPPRNKIDHGITSGHEIGHAIGLSHIAPGNWLQPTYSTSISSPQAGDIAEAVRRYGPSVVVQPPPPPPPPPAPGGNDMPWDIVKVFVLNALKAQLQKWIEDGSAQRFLQDLLNRFLNGNIKTVDQLFAGTQESAVQHLSVNTDPTP